MQAAVAADFGYDETPAVHEEKAVALPLKAPPPKPAAKAPPSKPTAKTPAAKPVQKTAAYPPNFRKSTDTPLNVVAPANADELAAEGWMQIYDFVAGGKLSDTQKESIKQVYERSLKAGNQDLHNVFKFWPKVASEVAEHPEQRDNYTALMRGLLRWRCRQLGSGQKASEAARTAECELVNEVLGPPMLAVAGPPPFTQEAVDAYSDMAIFIYEQKHPGKTIDGNVNREIFAKVVCDKFTNAPSPKDREAMAGFDLIWSKFKIVWTKASEEQKALLMQELEKRGAGSALQQAHDSVLDAVIKYWPSVAST